MTQDCPQFPVNHYINSELQEIAKGYRITYREEDGYDSYGIKYWVECKNGWSGRSWDVVQALFYSQKTYLNQLVLKGLSFGGDIYYFHPDIVFEDKLHYTLITPQEHKMYLEISTKLENIRHRICVNYNNYIKDKSYSNYGPWYDNLKRSIFVSSVLNFKKSLVILTTNNYRKPINIDGCDYNKIKQLLRWGKLTKDELIILGIDSINNAASFLHQ